MISEHLKKARYVASFLRRNLVHTNLQILYQCNFRCRICDFWREPYQDMPRLSASQIKVISEKLNQIGPQVISIGGGEPLLHSEIIDIVQILSRHHFPVMICNGWYMTAERARALWAAGMYEISVSVDFADPQKHDQQRGVEGAYHRALNALKLLHQNRTQPHQRVHMISVIMEENLEEVESLIRLCKDLGFTYLVTLYSDTRGTKHGDAPHTEPSEALLELSSRYPHFVSLRGYLAKFTHSVPQDAGRCRAGKNLCNVGCTGDVSLCIDRVDQPVGNLLHEDADAIRRKLLERYRENTCRSCWTSCRGSIETLMYDPKPLDNLRDYYRMAKSIPLGQAFS